MNKAPKYKADAFEKHLSKILKLDERYMKHERHNSEDSYYYWQALVDRTKTIIVDYKEIFKRRIQ